MPSVTHGPGLASHLIVTYDEAGVEKHSERSDTFTAIRQSNCISIASNIKNYFDFPIIHVAVFMHYQSTLGRVGQGG